MKNYRKENLHFPLSGKAAKFHLNISKKLFFFCFRSFFFLVTVRDFYKMNIISRQKNAFASVDRQHEHVQISPKLFNFTIANNLCVKLITVLMTGEGECRAGAEAGCQDRSFPR